MSLETIFELEGQWAGNYKLWFSPTEPHLESETTAGIKRGVNFTCAKIAYDWVYEEKKQEGLIICAFNPNRELVRAAFFDSFHMANDFMECEGSARDGEINVMGSYTAPVGPSWYWRTILDAPDGAFRMRMFNIHPDGTEDIAVEAVYSRGE
ncbi:MAG: DUF1579 domain-containing protein [Acidobacteria bacterium]|nr:MAG: DUF1579 domain-containing protein [Acidobacteriota bacterium]REJ98150.1 MAG: DUF1579 domain-containing protein [Acidobacteriota bacterium]REK16893.1 MAG: DUF1579 domain-containing protein [Acidobacteriota bacterium]REK42804.1 MAG: DUF1579 domain-containing protein [Acidobacteriota bacterium]